jgi:putative transposase
MAHPYPARCPQFDYRGRYRYLLTFSTFERQPRFTSRQIVDLVLPQVLRAAKEKGFEVFAYCFMPDHVHLVVRGVTAMSDFKAFVRAAKQYSGYYFAREIRMQLWQRYCHERIVRHDLDFVRVVRYVVENPVRAGLAQKPEDYPFTGSSRWSTSELVDWCRTPTVIDP